MTKIPVASVDLSMREKLYVKEAVTSGWISSTGKFVDYAEELLREKFNCSYALTCSNGTVALHLALLSVGIGEGDEVICPDLTYVATVNAVRYCNAVPILLDVDSTATLDPNLIEDSITPKTKAILAVDLYGHSANMLELRKIADTHGLFLIEDAAEGHASKCHDLTIGTFADVTTLSFFANKVIVSGEGGACLTNNEHFYKRMRILWGQGMSAERRYFHPTLGYNYRMSNIQCAILCGQLERMEDIICDRNYVYSLYDEALKGIPGIKKQECAEWSNLTPWLYSILVEKEYGRTRDELMSYLAENDVDTRPFFIPIHKLPPHMDKDYRVMTKLERRKYDLDHYYMSTKLSNQGMNLPTYNFLDKESIEMIAEFIREYQYIE
jgi:perosamine synthetase